MNKLKEIRRSCDGLVFDYGDGRTVHLGFGYAAQDYKEMFVESILELERRAKFFAPPPGWRPPAPQTRWQRIKAVFRP